MAKGFKKLKESFRTQASPEVITALVVKALKVRRPRTRYSAGTGAIPLLFMRKILSDRMYDYFLYRMLK